MKRLFEKQTLHSHLSNLLEACNENRETGTSRDSRTDQKTIQLGKTARKGIGWTGEVIGCRKSERCT